MVGNESISKLLGFSDGEVREILKVEKVKVVRSTHSLALKDTPNRFRVQLTT